MKITQKNIVIGVSVGLVATILYFALKKSKVGLAKDIASDDDFQKLLEKIDKAPK